ncbi:MAG: sulfatase-like hydrolase/transferase [Fuerstiella sp.]|nr:sulfatase-like hydrolase/transferase [Fuerstiella sp.]MCP4856878.1 sulfatase-like hydrolase/transferase [Fuerstiella sp.]
MLKSCPLPAIVFAVVCSLTAANAHAEKPNIVLILADDVSADMFSCYGQEGSAKTPNVDRIADEGIQFRTCFAPAICGPSRALLMTGVYGNRTGAFRNDMWAFDSRGTLFTAQHSWGKLLRDGGYKTAVAGKWHCSAKEPWESEVGFDEYCMYEGPDKIKSHFGIDVIASGQRRNIKLPDVRYWYSSMIQNGKYVEVAENDFGPDQRCEFLMEFMERKAKASEPFVAYWPTVIPHGPYSTTPDAGAVMDIELQKPDTSGMSKEEKKEALAEYTRRQNERFVNLIQYMDKLIGRLIVKAEELGIYENTYFIFCADNGTAVTAKDRGVERGVHVPYVVRGPGVKRRGVTDELTDFADIAPTLLDMAGVAHPADVLFDGKSQLPFLTGQTNTHRQWIYAYTGPVQVLRTRDYLLEARSPFYGKPDGRFYLTGDNRFGRGYQRVENLPKHAAERARFEKIVRGLPSHLEREHPFWTSKLGKRWLANNPDTTVLAEKQLYNHPDYSFYDETD